VSVTLEDKSGLPAMAVLQQDFDGDNQPDFSIEVCGATDQPVKFRAGVDVQVWAQEGPCEDGTNAMSTVGTVSATFTR
jgi:hypothetical protein